MHAGVYRRLCQIVFVCACVCVCVCVCVCWDEDQDLVVWMINICYHVSRISITERSRRDVSVCVFAFVSRTFIIPSHCKVKRLSLSWKHHFTNSVWQRWRKREQERETHREWESESKRERQRETEREEEWGTEKKVREREIFFSFHFSFFY